jgi:hypothetical protein
VEDLPAAANQRVTLFPIRSALRYTIRATRSGGGDSEFTAPNPPYGAILNYFLREPSTDVQFEILDTTGKIVRRLKGRGDSVGVHRITWDLRADGPAPNTRGPQVLPGSYTVRLTQGSAAIEQRVQGSAAAEQRVNVQLDPDVHVTEADLRAQWDALNRIGAMIQRVTEMRRTADEHSAANDWQKLRATLARPRGLSGSETGPRLLEQLQSLSNLIDGPNAAPTPAMMRLLDELEEAYAKAEADFKRLSN